MLSRCLSSSENSKNLSRTMRSQCMPPQDEISELKKDARFKKDARMLTSLLTSMHDAEVLRMEEGEEAQAEEREEEKEGEVDEKRSVCEHLSF